MSDLVDYVIPIPVNTWDRDRERLEHALAAIEILIGEKHPGHPNQSVHSGSTGGSAGLEHTQAAIHDRVRAGASLGWKKRGAGAEIRGSGGTVQVSPLGKGVELQHFGPGPSSRRPKATKKHNDVGAAMDEAEGLTGARARPAGSGIKVGALARSSNATRVPGLVKASPFGRGASGEQLKRAPLHKGRKLQYVKELTFSKDLKTGQFRWFSVVSNNFEDRDGELFEEKAHNDYVDYIDATKDYPELWLWHTPGTRFGVTDFVAYADNFLIASGTIDEGKEYVAESLVKSGVKAVSHGYRYRRKDRREDGSYSSYKTFEISVLPNHRASNTFTLWGTQEAIQIKEGHMSLRTDKKAFLVEHLGEDRANLIEGHLEALSKELQGSGLRFKEVEAVEDEEKITDPDPKPEGEGDGEDDGDAEPEGAAEPEVEGAKVMAELLTRVKEIRDGLKEMASVKETITKFQGTLDALDDRLEALEKSDDDKLIERLMPRKASVIKASRASQSDDNVLDEKATKNLESAEGAPTSPVTGYLEQLGVRVN